MGAFSTLRYAADLNVDETCVHTFCQLSWTALAALAALAARVALTTLAALAALATLAARPSLLRHHRYPRICWVVRFDIADPLALEVAPLLPPAAAAAAVPTSQGHWRDERWWAISLKTRVSS